MATTFNTSLASNIGSPTTSTIVTISETNQTGNIVTVNDTEGLAKGMKIIVLGTTIGNLVADTYYIQSVVSGTEIVLSTTENGAPFNPGNGTGGSMTGIIEKTVNVLTTPANAKTTVVGLALTNCTPDLQIVKVQLVDNANGNASAYFAYNVIIPQNESLKLVNGGERLVLGPDTTINVITQGDGGLDAVVSFVEIV